MLREREDGRVWGEGQGRAGVGEEDKSICELKGTGHRGGV